MLDQRRGERRGPPRGVDGALALPAQVERRPEGLTAPPRAVPSTSRKHSRPRPAPRTSRKRATAPPRSKHRPETAPPLAQAGSVYDPFPNRAESGSPHGTALRGPAHRPEATRGPAPHRNRKRTRPFPAPRRGRKRSRPRPNPPEAGAGNSGGCVPPLV